MLTTLRKKSNVLRAMYRQYMDSTSYLRATGWVESIIQDCPISSEGEPLPWLPFPAISFLRSHLHEDHVLFEYGSGYSTLFYAKHVGKVYSVEHDRIWIERLNDLIPANVTLMHLEADNDGLYCRSIQRTNAPINVVIVDGKDRNNCIKTAAGAMAKDGIIILDDSQRPSYSEGIEYLLSLGFKQIDLEGLKPKGHGVYKTSVFYRRDNCFNI